MHARSIKERDQLPPHEELLVDYAQRLRQFTAGRRAVHVHLSKLLAHHRREHHLRIAAAAFDGLIRRFDGQCFRLTNGDIVIITKGASVNEIDGVVLKLKYLFSEDPLSYSDDAESEFRFCTWYDMEQDYAAFAETANRLLQEHVLAQQPRPNPGGRVVPAAPPSMAPMDPVRLGRLETALANADLSPHVRRQAVCAVLPGQRPTPVFAELFVSIDELRRRIMPDVEILASRWLFQHLTEVLDCRVLQVLPDLEADVTLATSININVSTILSDDFQLFDRDMKRRSGKSFILEIQPIDLFADVGAFFFARDFVRERGYKLCLDGLNHMSLPLLRRDDLGVDFLKVQWSADVAHDSHGRRREMLVEAIRNAGSARVVLCRCDSDEAIAFGHSLGINLFQGRRIDRLLA